MTTTTSKLLLKNIWCIILSDKFDKYLDVTDYSSK